MTTGLSEAQIHQVRTEFRRTGNSNEVARRIGVSSSTVDRYIRDLRATTERFTEGDLSWQDRAACIGYSRETFFPDGASDKAWIAEAKAICADCPVIEVCGDYGKRTHSGGVWGGKFLGYRGHREGAEKVA